MHAQVLQLLTQRLARPLTGSGSELLGRAAFAQFADRDAAAFVARFADKAVTTLRDGRRHDFIAIPPGGGIAVWCNTWPGTHLEALPLRFGSYADQLAGKASWLVERGVRLAGLLEIDAYVGEPDDLEVEYSFLPGRLVGGVRAPDARWSNIMLNVHLCSDEQRQALEGFMD
ncbi:hypothetical protein GCM10020358_39650 [Amorphoplanes nipponensis]|uniref:Uncharacterized protein n=1 Tax=Actinoplanes nipponensis TaxID=135950 RepID=A0A919JKU5_9ACTN|nr:hypothetical protein Ani05nite_45310 [Actinoplanes nipponensis]